MPNQKCCIAYGAAIVFDQDISGVFKVCVALYDHVEMEICKFYKTLNSRVMVDLDLMSATGICAMSAACLRCCNFSNLYKVSSVNKIPLTINGV
jgi:hypothetical protein